MHDETPEIDYNRFESIKSYFNVFENKLSQAGPLLITLHKSNTGASMITSSKDINSNAMIDQLVNIPVNGVKKIAKSASFASVNSPLSLESFEDRLCCAEIARKKGHHWF